MMYLIKRFPWVKDQTALQARQPHYRPRHYSEIGGMNTRYARKSPQGGVEWVKSKKRGEIPEDASSWTDPWEPRMLAQAYGGIIVHVDGDKWTEEKPCTRPKPKAGPVVHKSKREW